MRNIRVQSSLLIALLGVATSQAAYSANITNNVTGVGPKSDLVSPYFCIQDANEKVTYILPPGKSIDGNKYSGNPYYVGGALRFGGCDAETNPYLGYLGLDLGGSTNSINSYDPPEGVHVKYQDGAIDAKGHLTGKIVYTDIEPNFNLAGKAPSKNSDWLFVGANLSGLEFSKAIDPVVIPNLSEEDVTSDYTDLKDTQAFLAAGMNTMRVPVSWSFLQLEGAGQGEINANYYNSYVKPLLETLTSAKVNTIVDLHTYMRYSKFGKEYSGCSGAPGSKCPDGTLVLDPKAYVDIWSKLYKLMRDDPAINMDYIMLDLVNVPVDVPDDKVFTLQVSMIKALRKAGFTGYILVEGNAWTGLHSWAEKSWQSQDGQTTYTNATLFTRENFNNAGITDEDLEKILINVHQYLDSDYSGNHDECLADLTTTGSGALNLDAFVGYLKENRFKAIVTEFGAGLNGASCTPPLRKFFDYMKTNSATGKDYGFVGWTIWSTGHGWGTYNLRVTPDSYHSKVMADYLKPKQTS